MFVLQQSHEILGQHSGEWMLFAAERAHRGRKLNFARRRPSNEAITAATKNDERHVMFRGQGGASAARLAFGDARRQIDMAYRSDRSHQEFIGISGSLLGFDRTRPRGPKIHRSRK